MPASQLEVLEAHALGDSRLPFGTSDMFDTNSNGNNKKNKNNKNKKIVIIIIIRYE